MEIIKVGSYVVVLYVVNPAYFVSLNLNKLHNPTRVEI